MVETTGGPSAPEGGAVPSSSGAPGWRGRVGVIQPAPGVMLEFEWARAMPEGVIYPVTRLPLCGGTSAHYSQMSALAPAASATLATANAGVIAYACAVGSLHQGPAAERQLMAELSRAAGGRPVIGMAQAAAEAMRHLAAKRIAVLTPYSDDINRLVAGYLRESGFTVSSVDRLPTANAITAADMRPDETVSAAVRALAGAPDADLLWIACSNVRSLDLMDQIEHVSKKWMLSSNQALLWRTLLEIGVPARIQGAGRLLAG